MRAFQFLQRCRPKNDLRTSDVSGFLRLMSEAFDVQFWTYRGGKVDLAESAIERRLRSLIDPQMPGAGASWVLSSHGGESPIIVRLATGSDEWGRDFFDVDFSHVQFLPDLSYFKRSIELCKPFEACIVDNKNEIELDSQERQRLSPNFQRPSIVRWFHYFGKPLVSALGGYDQCLATPAFKTERFRDGVLLQLTEEPFEACNSQHRERQRLAMRHLALN